MKNLFFLFIILITINSFSQDQKGLNSNEFQKLKTSYSEMTNSETYRAMSTQSKLIASKLNGLQIENVTNEVNFNKWITENISKTKFSSIDEANSMFKLSMELMSKVMDNYKDVYIKLKEASQSQVVEILME